MCLEGRFQLRLLLGRAGTAFLRSGLWEGRVSNPSLRHGGTAYFHGSDYGLVRPHRGDENGRTLPSPLTRIS